MRWCRRSILRDLRRVYMKHPTENDYGAVDTLRCFKKDEAKAKTVLNQLILEGLVIMKPIDGGVGARLNPEKIKEINAELALDWKWVVGIVVGIIAVIVALLQWLKP